MSLSQEIGGLVVGGALLAWLILRNMTKGGLLSKSE